MTSASIMPTSPFLRLARGRPTPLGSLLIIHRSRLEVHDAFAIPLAAACRCSESPISLHWPASMATFCGVTSYLPWCGYMANLFANTALSPISFSIRAKLPRPHALPSGGEKAVLAEGSGGGCLSSNAAVEAEADTILQYS